jgi:hypothetical protein
LPASAVVDNDVLIKAACFSLLAELLAAFGGAGSIGILGAAKYVVRDRLARDERILDRERATASWQAFLGSAEQIEPSPPVVELATRLEETASDAGVFLHVGESLLCAIAVDCSALSLVTGDKQAIVAMQVLVASVNELVSLSGRVVCLEQLIEGIVARLGPEATRLSVCGEPDADRALSICFQCSSGVDGRLDPEGLRSYIEDLRKQAPNMLSAKNPF